MRKLEGHKKLGQDTAGAPDPNWPMGYSIPCDVPSSLGTGGSGGGELRLGEWLGVGQWVVGNCTAHDLYIAMLVLLLLSFY